MDPYCTRGLPKGLLSKLENWVVETQRGMTLVICQIGLQSVGPCHNVSDCKLLPTEASTSVAYAQLKFGNASCSRPLPACLLCFRQRIKEQCILQVTVPCICFPVTQHLWQVYFKNYRFWCSLVALLEC